MVGAARALFAANTSWADPYRVFWDQTLRVGLGGFELAYPLDSPHRSGWAVPMATDIAFVVGALALLGARVPRGLKIMLLSLALVFYLVLP